MSKWTLDEDGEPDQAASGRTTRSGTRTRSWDRHPTRRTSPRCHGSSGASARARSPARPRASIARSTSRTRRSAPAESFDGLGGLAVAIFDNQLHTLPRLGRFSWENTVVQGGDEEPHRHHGHGGRPGVTRPCRRNSQVYMYVGKQRTAAGSSVLRRNGLDNGELYVLVPSDPGRSRARRRSPAARSRSSGH